MDLEPPKLDPELKAKLPPRVRKALARARTVLDGYRALVRMLRQAKEEKWPRELVEARAWTIAGNVKITCRAIDSADLGREREEHDQAAATVRDPQVPEVRGQRTGGEHGGARAVVRVGVPPSGVRPGGEDGVS